MWVRSRILFQDDTNIPITEENEESLQQYINIVMDDAFTVMCMQPYTVKPH
jgi:hypothetical protein